MPFEHMQEDLDEVTRRLGKHSTWKVPKINVTMLAMPTIALLHATDESDLDTVFVPDLERFVYEFWP